MACIYCSRLPILIDVLWRSDAAQRCFELPFLVSLGLPSKVVGDRGQSEDASNFVFVALRSAVVRDAKVLTLTLNVQVQPLNPLCGRGSTYK